MPKKLAVIVIIVLALIVGFFAFSKKTVPIETADVKFWPLASIDTVKYSRDVAGQYMNDPSFDKTIELQVRSIAATGATHIAIGTPYDERFIPFIKRWVTISRKYGLKIWFRGNFSGWEKWFNYPSITREEHKALLKQFITAHGDLFEDGDIFSSCTECENGGPGDPRSNGDVAGHRQFLIDEYQISKAAFRQVGKNVSSNYFPMNYDVASLVMDKPTTEALGGIVTIDHYVADTQKMNDDINRLADASGGKIVIGEFGAPIPDLHGNMTESEQATWISQAFGYLAQNKNVAGVNYWTSFGGSTKIWQDNGTPTQAVAVVTNYYNPKTIRGYVINQAGDPVGGATVASNSRYVTTEKNGGFAIAYTGKAPSLRFTAPGYIDLILNPIDNGMPHSFSMTKTGGDFVFRIKAAIYTFFH